MTSSTGSLSASYVVDTNALMWYLTGDKRLSNKALAIFRAAEDGQTQLIISAIVIAELYYANAKHQWFADFAREYIVWQTKPYFTFIDFKPDAVLDFEKDKSVPEIHDRIITGIARRYGVPLITIDPLITASKLVQVVW